MTQNISGKKNCLAVNNIMAELMVLLGKGRQSSQEFGWEREWGRGREHFKYLHFILRPVQCLCSLLEQFALCP